MGSGWGDSSEGGTADPGSPPGGWEPEPIEVELVVELDDVDIDGLPARGVNSAASEFETIDGMPGGRSRLAQLPRGVRVVGVLAAVVALTVAVWPSAKERRAVPQPTPIPSPVDTDLYKVRLGETTLQDTQGDHATLGLQLTNSATAQLTVVSAELWDAVGTRIGSAAVWPAKNLAAEATAFVPVTLPYSCQDPTYLPVLPITIRYSISSPQDPSIRRDYASPLTDSLWGTFTRQRVTQCARLGDGEDPAAPSSGNQIELSSIDTTQPIGAPSDPQGFDLTFTLDVVGTARWALESVRSESQDATVTASGTPVVVGAGRTGRVTTHWHIKDCANPPNVAPGSELSLLVFTVRMADATGPEAADHQIDTEVRPGLLTEMVQVACGT